MLLYELEQLSPPFNPVAPAGRRYGNVAGVRASVQPAKLKRAYASGDDEASKSVREGKFQFLRGLHKLVCTLPNSFWGSESHSRCVPQI